MADVFDDVKKMHELIEFDPPTPEQREEYRRSLARTKIGLCHCDPPPRLVLQTMPPMCPKCRKFLHV